MGSRKSEIAPKTDVPVNLPFGMNSIKGEPLQIKSIKVDVHVIGHVAEVSACLTYFNEGKTPVTSEFTFPEDENSTAYQLEAHIGGQQIITAVERKPQACLTKEDAINKGTAAMFYKEDKSLKGIFSCMLGKVAAQSEAALVLKYVTELPQEPDGQLNFTLPTVLNPRYSPGTPGKGDKKSEKHAKLVPSSKHPYKFSLTVVVKGYRKISSITSGNVKLNVTYEEDNMSAKVTIDDDLKFESDLKMCVLYEEPYSPQIIIENGNPKSEALYKKDICMLSFQPDLRKVSMATNGEYVFIIEISGKMEGTKIGNAKKALQLYLRSLPADCFFNIICYGEKVNFLFRNSSKYTEKTLKEALVFLEKMKTYNTNNAAIFKPLDHIYGKKLISGHPRKVFLLTDGKTKYDLRITTQVKDLVKKNTQKTNTRIFILAMGYGHSTYLLKDVADIGHGRVEFISEKERVQTKAVALLKYSMQPCITNIELKWDTTPGLSVDFIPDKIQNVISAGERLVVFAVIQGDKENTSNAPSTVTLKGIKDGKTVSHSVTFNIHKSDDVTVSAPVHHLATKTQIKLLEDKEEEFIALHNPELPKWVEFCSEIDLLRNKIINLSCSNNIISKYTYYTVMTDREKNAGDKPGHKIGKIPTLTDIFICELKLRLDMHFHANLKSFALFDDGISEDGSSEKNFLKRSKEKSSGKQSLFKAKEQISSEGDLLPVSNMSSFAACISDDSGGAVLVTDDDQMMTVLSLQQFQGQWTISAELLQLVGILKEDLEKMDISKDQNVLCTAIVLGWLMEMYPHRQDEWQMIETKALLWISSHSQTTPVEKVIQLTSQALWPH